MIFIVVKCAVRPDVADQWLTRDATGAQPACHRVSPSRAFAWGCSAPALRAHRDGVPLCEGQFPCSNWS